MILDRSKDSVRVGRKTNSGIEESNGSRQDLECLLQDSGRVNKIEK